MSSYWVKFLIGFRNPRAKRARMVAIPMLSLYNVHHKETKSDFENSRPISISITSLVSKILEQIITDVLLKCNIHIDERQGNLMAHN